ncbi:cell wall-binding repeat-containing protein [Stomatohabitans albus]|uniref:cell wall-binding repeat-containing protein n=1 Tax=Stomatohabitans albus TaxID=3110766 RepID=UPI00300D8DBD
MFTYQNTKNALVAVVIASGLALPLVGSPVALAQSSLPPVTSPVPANAVIHEIGDQAAFDQLFSRTGALAQANATPTGSTRADHVVRLANGTYRLPAAIDYQNLSITITSNSPVTALGVDHKDAVRPRDEGAVLTIEDPRSSAFATTCTVRSPLIVQDVHIANDVRGKSVFQADSDLSLLNVNGLRSDPYRNVAIVNVANEQAAPRVVIEHSTFDGVSPLAVDKTLGSTRFEHNVVKHPAQTGRTLKFGMGAGQRAWVPTVNDHIVRDNLFIQDGNTTTIQVHRPGVTIHHNEFRLPANGRFTAVGIELGSSRSRRSTLPKIQAVVIEDNTLTGAERPVAAEGITLSYSDSFEPGGVSIARNDFGDLAIAVKTGVVWTDDAPINFVGNYTGQAVNELNPATIKDPALTVPPGAGLLAPVPQPPIQPQPPAQPQPPVPGPQVQPTPTPSASPSVNPAGQRTVIRVSGETRVETSVAASKTTFATGAETVILARSDVAADSVSATPLAHAVNAPILLTQSDTLHPASANEIRRLGAKTVYVMGGDAAVTPAVEQAVAKLGVKVIRIAGANRAATAIATAEHIAKVGKVDQVLVVDGTDWQSSLIAAPAAAQVNGVVVLTNGAVIAPETTAFLDAFTSLKVTAVGDQAIKATARAQSVIAGADPSVLSVKVASVFFPDPKMVGVATTTDFADALTGGAHIAAVNGPLLLVPAETPTVVTEWMTSKKKIETIYVYGGPTRIGSTQAEALSK